MTSPNMSPPDSVPPAQDVTENELVDPYELDSREIFWRDRFEIFESHGYKFRPRFKPGWVSSWTVKNVDPIVREDCVCLGVSGPHNFL